MEIFIVILVAGLVAKFMSKGANNVQVACKLHSWNFNEEGMYYSRCGFKAGGD